jgi:beta-lactamase regulating signal transducer with metallopeptidase domain
MMFLLKASLVLAIAQALVMAMPRMAASVKHAILTVGLSAFLVVPLFEAMVPALRVSVNDVVRTEERAVGQAEARPAPNDSTFGLADVAALLWFAGVCTIGVRWMRARRRVRAIVRNAVEPSQRIRDLFNARNVRLLRSADVHVPMVWGRTLLLPDVAESWSEEVLRATFIHELGHLRRLDQLTLGLMNSIAALYWFHPQVWIARRAALAECERACDDLVLRAGSHASSYAQHLLDVARLMPRREPQLLSMSRPEQLEGRMLSILSPSTNRQSIGGKRLMLTLVTFLAVVVPLSAVQRVALTPAPLPLITAEELAARPYHVVEKLEARKCTLNLSKPAEPTQNPAIAEAMERLRVKAAGYHADGVANVKCLREIGIGFRCPTSVVCGGDVVVFDK